MMGVPWEIEPVSNNKKTIETYIEGFNRTDHEMILSCVTDDVEWIMPGFFHHVGKAAFDGEIENAAFSGMPRVTISRIVEEDDVVVAEGTVESELADGAPFSAAFCDVFEMRDARIRRLIGYLVATT
jgi:ketosteroid isomerase-like protein